MRSVRLTGACVRRRDRSSSGRALARHRPSRSADRRAAVGRPQRGGNPPPCLLRFPRCEKAMAPNPRERFATDEDMRRALEACAASLEGDGSFAALAALVTEKSSDEVRRIRAAVRAHACSTGENARPNESPPGRRRRAGRPGHAHRTRAVSRAAPRSTACRERAWLRRRDARARVLRQRNPHVRARTRREASRSGRRLSFDDGVHPTPDLRTVGITQHPHAVVRSGRASAREDRQGQPLPASSNAGNARTDRAAGEC